MKENETCNRLTDLDWMAEAIGQSEKCVPSDTCYCVGAVIVTSDARVYKGYTHETSVDNHAEEEAVLKADKDGVSLCGATVYSTIEPCSERKSKDKSCTALLIEKGVSRVVFAFKEPSHFVNCMGESLLAEAGIEVELLAGFEGQVKKINSHIPGL